MFVGSGVELRIFLIACALLVALITGLLFAAPALVDVTRYRGDIEAVATRAAGQPVQINGALAFRILPTPRFIAEKPDCRTAVPAFGSPPVAEGSQG